MRTFFRIIIRSLAVVGALCLAVVLVLMWERKELSEYLLRSALEAYSVEVARIGVVEEGPRGAKLAPVELAWRGQKLGVAKVSLERRASAAGGLGDIRVEGVDLRLDIDAWRKAEAVVAHMAEVRPAAQQAALHPAPLPDFSKLTVDGRVHAILPGVPGPVDFSLEATPAHDGRIVSARWRLSYTGLGAEGQAEESVDGGGGRVCIQKLDIQAAVWRDMVKRLVPAAEGWDWSGDVHASAEIIHGGAGVQGGARLHLAGAGVSNTALNLEASGIELELALDDVGALRSGTGQRLFVRKLTVSGVEVTDIDLRFQLLGADQVSIESLTAQAFGGTVSLQPVRFNPAGPEYAATIELRGVDAGRIMQLLPDAKAKVSALIDGSVPLFYGPSGVRFGRGWLAMHEGSAATLQLDQPGLLTSGMAPTGAAYSILKSIESGILNLRLKELRAELYEVESGTARSVALHIAGEPLDPKVKAPVELDLNVNGPLAPLIRWGMDSRVAVGVK